MNGRARSALATLVLASIGAGCGGPSRDAGSPHIVTTDVHQFVAALDQLNPSDSTCSPFDAVFAEATQGLRKYRSKFGVGPRELCAAVRRNPARYAALRERLPRLDSISAAVSSAFSRFKTLYPEATFPPVYFVVGNGITAGTTTLGPSPIILIGTELVGSIEGLPHMITHELVHTQQRYPWRGMLTGGPAFLRGSVLRHSLKEGSADFLADLVTGAPPPSLRRVWADAHEAVMWQSFQRDRHGSDYSRWLYNGWNRAALGDWPSDLGYEMGYRITRAYYERAADKAAAVREILHIRDFDRFLAASGYDGRTAR